ncbi:hypothetical protein R7P34_12835 [Vibrio sp. 780]|uniref:hypothetical protein n=1 Tax=unclassified Vibrio TaxID=2614977 RepID=UPI002964C68C|nr:MULTISPECIES: hypothetical protein [unclassified Vibrio]MDW1950430.1 hypothetical protein [Vibrio sp. 812(2023)]MDW1991290.1 hypothetical protein [Vibrio sp. 780]
MNERILSVIERIEYPFDQDVSDEIVAIEKEYQIGTNEVTDQLFFRMVTKREMSW